MPTYDYQCKKCKHRFELFHSMSDDSIKRCPKCKGRAAKLPSAGAGLLFKGSGFYITDYRSSSYKEKASKEKSASSGSDQGGKGSDKSGAKKDAKGKDS